MAIVGDVMQDGDARRGVINNIKFVLLDLNFRAVHIRTKILQHYGIKSEFIFNMFSRLRKIRTPAREPEKQT